MEYKESTQDPKTCRYRIDNEPYNDPQAGEHIWYERSDGLVECKDCVHKMEAASARGLTALKPYRTTGL